MAIEKKALDFISFIGAENEQLLISFANEPGWTRIIQRVQGLFLAALENREIAPEQVITFNLIGFAHYHYLYSSATLMRCHLSEAYNSGRCAIDAFLNAWLLITDPSLKQAYVDRKKPFDQVIRWLKNKMQANKPVHRNIAKLVELHQNISEFASHADVNSFAHRFAKMKDSDKDLYALMYFQYAPDRDERQIHFMTQQLIFILGIDLVSQFLIEDTKFLPTKWREEVHILGGEVEHLRLEATNRIKTKMEKSQASPPQ